jgi:hypothetical protein
VFFERIIEWGWADAPKACPIMVTDLPKVDDPLPRFLDDNQANVSCTRRSARNHW